MMKKLKNMLFSMELTGILLLLFTISIAYATFVENDFGTITAKARVYNAKWFEIMLLLLAVNMTGSIFKHKMYLKHKWTILLFHVAFLVIFIGAAVTRYVGYEGMMSIREGSTSNEFRSEETYIRVWASDGDIEAYDETKLFPTPGRVAKYKEDLSLGNKKVEVEVLDYYLNAADTYVSEEGGTPVIWLVVSGGSGGRQNIYLENGQKKDFNGLSFAFDTPGQDENTISFVSRNDTLFLSASDSVNHVNMMANTSVMLPPQAEHPFMPMNLYKYGNINIVLKQYFQSAKRKLVSTEGQEGMTSMDAFTARVTVDDVSETVNVYGGKGFLIQSSELELSGVKVSLNYGAKLIILPFAIRLDDFQLERYPGSNSPSSYASEVTVFDEPEDLVMPYRIYMNNVLNYKGYRFFQSSYDRDEMGTVLSVNHDAAGTIITYIGYFLMSLGMFLTIFSKSSRFRLLARLSTKIRQSRKEATVLLILGALFLGGQVSAQPSSARQDLPVVSEEHAKAFGELLIQDRDGRIKPLNTVASEVLRKIARKTSFEGMTPEQVFLGIMAYPELWQSVPIIKVTHPQLKEFLGAEGKLAAFSQVVDLSGTGQYKISEYVERAYAKKPANQSKFDKDVMHVDERVNIFYMVYNGSFLTIFPVPGHENYKWITASDASQIEDKDEQLFVGSILSMYLEEVRRAIQSGNWSAADEHLGYILKYQEKYGSEIMPSAGKVSLEIFYNEFNIFKRLSGYYGLIGFVLLVLHFINILKPKIKLKKIIQISSYIVVLLFLMHTAGLIIRWNISGHAPWSNGYESLIYIAWATSLSGLIFVWRSEITLSVTALLSSLILAVAGMSWMDPEITNLVPVLKSYWLIIHVAIITASYGFLALGALLGFLNLVIMILKGRKNYKRLDLTVTELNYIIEMTLVIGLFMLTIGTFLGGVWANESWGRYWGWDPKETWALATVVFYSFVVHMRFIPGFRGNFAFSFASLISYSFVLMTYFGVNYYLSGLHSYAAGDPVPVPSFVYYTIVIIGIVSTIAYINDRKYRILDAKAGG
jgi:cytochrome c-type biogenesis protein CcsB